MEAQQETMTRRQPWIRGVLSGATVGFVVASVMSYLDWRLNPSGIFHGEGGTSWGVVWETWVSWFVTVEMVGASLIGLTVSTKFVSVLSCPSLTVSVIIAVPL